MTLTTPAPSPTRARFHALEVAGVERLTEDAVAVTFAVPADLADAYAFDAGQSVTVRRFVDGVEERRDYSICARVGAPLRIGVREIPDGLFSAWLGHDVRPGDMVEVQTPTGRFRADPDADGRHLCIAAGSGITPVLSIAATLLANPSASVTLLYGNRTTASVMFAEELADLKDAYGPRFEIVHVLSREPRDVELFSGRLDADRVRRLLGALVPVGDLDHVWLCGPYGMITDAREALRDRGVAVERIHSELFYVDEPPPELHRPDPVLEGETSTVTVVLDGRRTTATVPRARTVLESAQTMRTDVPFACKGGVCGTCRARVCGGEVDMRRNYALDDDELAAGFVLTCQSHPVGDELTVDFDA
ncbi:ring-1,2-phenylacetyl-CoA epoxidase subunit PaaE [Mumia flava]|uniref:Ring-1,2-phenylacetyl-CoA epoxidase subunit PaaE n=1 Tax=Mumia flava TaxID=1348852 RepID=A0A0B2B0N0_9ACTN|nr:1,2-phenylacetyl-CoA epoxidase subunit PaaE [Mumia flava]PJJ54320.1 ring-1,2-phenylacetyl-CoA epoxidase subunit PaaE [Mumia flava]